MFKGTKQHIKNFKKKHKNDLLPESSNLIQFTLGAWPRHIQRCRSGPWLALEAAQASEWTKTVVQEIENKTSIKYKLVLFVSFLSVIFCLYDTVCICLCSVSASICTLYGPGSAMRCQENWSAYQEKCPFLRPAGTFNIGAAESNLWLEQMGGPCLCLAMLRFHLCAASKHFLSLPSWSQDKPFTLSTLFSLFRQTSLTGGGSKTQAVSREYLNWHSLELFEMPRLFVCFECLQTTILQVPATFFWWVKENERYTHLNISLQK